MGIEIKIGDCLSVLKNMPDASIDCCVTSPPYFGLRDYGHDGQIGQEPTPKEFVASLVDVFQEVNRALKDDGSLWLNIGDSYNGSGKGAGGDGSGKARYVPEAGTASTKIIGLKPKDLIGIPWRVAFALQDAGWYLRNDIIWSKPNPMPESVKDRCTRAHEYVFHLTKSSKYYFDADAIAEDATYSGVTGQDASGFKDPKKFNGKHSDKQRGHSRRHAGFNERWDSMSKAEQCSGKRNKRTVWNIATRPFSGAHFATMAPELAKNCILAGCPVGGTVLDPFGGAGTTGLVADENGRNAMLIELNPEYAEIARERITQSAPLFVEIK